MRKVSGLTWLCSMRASGPGQLLLRLQAGGSRQGRGVLGHRKMIWFRMLGGGWGRLLFWVSFAHCVGLSIDHLCFFTVKTVLGSSLEDMSQHTFVIPGDPSGLMIFFTNYGCNSITFYIYLKYYICY